MAKTETRQPARLISEGSSPSRAFRHSSPRALCWVFNNIIYTRQRAICGGSLNGEDNGKLTWKEAVCLYHLPEKCGFEPRPPLLGSPRPGHAILFPPVITTGDFLYHENIKSQRAAFTQL